MQEGDGPTPSEVLHARIEIEPTMTTVGTSTKTKTEGVGRRNQRRVAWKPRTMVERDGLERAVQEIRDTVRVKWIHIYGSCMHMRSFKVGLQRKIGDTGAQSSRIWACNTSRDWVHGAYCLGQFHKIQPFWGGELGHEIRLDSLFGIGCSLLEN